MNELHAARVKRLRDRIEKSMSQALAALDRGDYVKSLAEVIALRDHVQQMHAGLARIAGTTTETLYEVPLRDDELDDFVFGDVRVCDARRQPADPDPR